MDAEETDRLELVEPRLLAEAGLPPTDHNLVVGQSVSLAASLCGNCGLPAFPVREKCERCGAETDVIELRSGVMVSCTEVIHPPPDSLVPVPYGIGFVSFPEGLSVLGLLEDPVETYAPGCHVEVVLKEAYPGTLTYAFAHSRAAS